MKILLVHNEYGTFSGEEAVVDRLTEMLKEHGHQVIRFTRSSTEIPDMSFGKLRAFFNGMYSFSSKQAIRRCIQEHKPNVIHVNNVFPLISPSILPECRKASVPVVMTVHNYRLICPNGLLMTDGRICEKCAGGREYWCVLNNCEHSPFKSVGYALRNYVARKRRLYLDNVTMYITLTQFQRQRLVREGFPKHRVAVIPNPVAVASLKQETNSADYVGFIGRVSPEKGIDVLLAAARKNSSIPFKVAGAFGQMSHMVEQAPSNLEFLGHVSGKEKDLFYRNCRIVILCSICYESFGNVLAEAMSHGRPVIASRIGGIPEVVADGVTGLLFEPGNAGDLQEKIRYLWERPELCRKMGQAGRRKASREYSTQKCYGRLMAAYRKAVRLAHVYS